MDKLVRKVSMGLAKSTTRRGFMSRMARGVVGIGLGASYLFGGNRYAFADADCKFGSKDNCGGDCTGSGDKNGCYGLPYCTGEGKTCGSNGECPTGMEYKGGWTCCCGPTGSKKQHTCNDCGPSDGGRVCICHHTGADC
jgi:hypothetical protein